MGWMTSTPEWARNHLGMAVYTVASFAFTIVAAPVIAVGLWVSNHRAKKLPENEEQD